MAAVTSAFDGMGSSRKSDEMGGQGCAGGTFPPPPYRGPAAEPTLRASYQKAARWPATTWLRASGRKGVGQPFQADRQARKPDLPPSFPVAVTASCPA